MQEEHDAHIQSLHDGIKERRQNMANSAQRQQQKEVRAAKKAQVDAQPTSGVAPPTEAPVHGQQQGGGNGGMGEDRNSGKAAAAAAAGAMGGGAGQGEKGGGDIMSAVTGMEEQEQADASGTARDVQAAKEAAEAFRHQQQEQQEQAEREREELRQQEEKEQQERVAREKQQQQQQQQEGLEQKARDQQALSSLQEGLEAAANKHASTYGYEYKPSHTKSIDPVLPAIPRGNVSLYMAARWRIITYG